MATTIAQPVDLTPFGFTPTETTVYAALSRAGPVSGYQLARHLNLARANAYQALHGLVGKGAAVSSGDGPRVFRAVQPQALLARIAQERARQLETLEQQIRSLSPAGAPATLEFCGERELRDLIMRSTAREAGPVRFLAPDGLLSGLLPIWRKREVDGGTTRLWALGGRPPDLPVPLEAVVDPALAHEHFHGNVALLETPSCALLGRQADDPWRGYWSSEPTLVGAVRAAFAALT